MTDVPGSPLVDAAAVSLVLFALAAAIYAVAWFAAKADDRLRRRAELRAENERFVEWWNQKHPRSRLALNKRGEVVKLGR